MVIPFLEDSDWKYDKVGKQVAAHDFCKRLIISYFSQGVFL